MQEVEYEWGTRVAELLASRHVISIPELGSLIRRPGSTKITTLLLRDPRFVVNNNAVSLEGVEPVEIKPVEIKPTPQEQSLDRKRKRSEAKELKVQQLKQKEVAEEANRVKRAKWLTLTIPSMVWEIILGNESIWCKTLTSWDWLWVLPQVSKVFRDAMHPRRTQIMQLMSTGSPRINKQQANTLFGLSSVDLANIPYRAMYCKGFYRYEIHYMCRDKVLQKAMTKKRKGPSTPTFETINALYLSRKKSV